MLQHNDRILAPGDLDAIDADQGEPAEMLRTNLAPFGLYDAIINSVAVAVDPRQSELAAEQLKTWFLRHHPQEAQRLNHIPIDTWDRMARNRKRGYNEFLEAMGNTFQRKEATHARSRALPDVTADSHNVKWSAIMDWARGAYHDSTSCFFSGNRVYLNGMASQGVTMLGFHDMEQGIGTGRVFVSPTWPNDDHPNTPNGLLLWGSYGHLEDFGWMPVRTAADVLISVTGLPYRTDFTDGVSWLGHQEPTEDEREQLRYLPQNYNSFPQIEVPAAFDCTNCQTHYPEMSSRITKITHQGWDEEAYNEARIVERELSEKLAIWANDETRFTPTGRQSLPWARRYAVLLKEADESNRERRRLGEVQNVEVHTCMECHYAQILPNR
jgi:hypothetical protein